jgi:Uri superfamily endonuclease
LNIQLSSVGSLDIEYAGNSETQLKTSFARKDLISNGYINGTLFDVASSLIRMKKHASRHIKEHRHGSIDHLISEFIVASNERLLSRMYQKLARAVARNHDNLEIFKQRMEPLLIDGKLRNKYFTVLARISHKGGKDLVLEYLNSQVENIQVEMIRHLQFAKKPRESLVLELVKLIRSDITPISAKQAAYVAIGSMSSMEISRNFLDLL